MKTGPSTALVFSTSAAVLVLEILAGRLMAPYVGISLETFTGIIGTVLAGIAIGSWAGGWLADQRDPRGLIGPSLILGGALCWMALPIIRLLGPQFVGGGSATIVLLTTCAFFLPSAVLSAVSPMVAKLRLESLDDTGFVVGGLSAAGTFGALAGTFITGFFLVSAVPTRPIVLAIGALLITAGVAVSLWLRAWKPTSSTAVLVVAAGLFAVPAAPPCDHETAYFCVRIEVDPNNPAGRDLILDQLRHAYVDLDDPTNLDVRYIRLFADVADALPVSPQRTLHIGGGGFSFPRYLRDLDPATYGLVLEIDPDLVAINRKELGLVTDEFLEVRSGDARLALGDLATDDFDMVVGDAFGSHSVPWHLTTAEFLAEVDRILRPDGVYVMNVIDRGASEFTRAELATLSQLFEHVGIILPAEGIPTDRRANLVLVASHTPLPALDIPEADGELFAGPIEAFINGQAPLRDDFAPVDQLLR